MRSSSSRLADSIRAQDSSGDRREVKCRQRAVPRRRLSGNSEQPHLGEERGRVAPQQEGAKRQNDNLAHHGSDAFLNREASLLGNAHARIMHRVGRAFRRPLCRTPLVLKRPAPNPPLKTRLLRRLQARRCGQTGGRLWKNAEVDHRVPLFRVWSDHRDVPWPKLLDFWGLPNLQVVNRIAHVTKSVVEARDRRAARSSNE